MKISIAVTALGFAYASPAFAQTVSEIEPCLKAESYTRGLLLRRDLANSDGVGPAFLLKLDQPRCALLSIKEGDKPIRIEKLETVQLQPKEADSRRALQHAVGTRVNVQINDWQPPDHALKISGATSSDFSITEKTDRVKTKAGELVVGKMFQKETEASCAKPPYAPNFQGSDCRVIRLNGQPFMAAPHIGIEKVYPSIDKPQIVVVWSHIGGNMNPTIYHLVDVTGKTPKIFFTGEGLSHKFSPTDNGILFQTVSGKTPLGDSYLNRFSYAFGSGKAVKTDQSVNYSTTPIGNKERPEEILSDPKLRKPLLDAIGEKHFAEYRKKMGVAGGVTLYSGRYFFASGCKPHDCCGNGTAFVLDVVSKEAWALEEASPTCKPEDAVVRMYGQSVPDDAFVKDRLGEWLKERGAEWSTANRHIAAP